MEKKQPRKEYKIVLVGDSGCFHFTRNTFTKGLEKAAFFIVTLHTNLKIDLMLQLGLHL